MFKTVLITLLILSSVAFETLPQPPPLPIPYNETYENLTSISRANITNNTVCVVEYGPWYDILGNIRKFFDYAGCVIWNGISGALAVFGPLGDFFRAFVDVLFKISWYIFIYLNLLVIAVINFGKAVLVALATIVSFAVWFFTFVTSVFPSIFAWLPWIIAVALLSMIADAVQRAVRAKSIYPMFELFMIWKNIIQAVVGFFGKVFEVVMKLIQLIVGLVRG